MNRHTPLKTTVIGMVFVALAACNQQQPEATAKDDFFPLGPHHQWEYQTTTERGAERTTGQYTVRNLGEVEKDQEKYFVRVNNHGTEYLFRRDHSGTYRLGVQTIVSDSIKFDLRQRYVLKTPHQTNTFWFADSHAFVIERTQPIRERFWNSHPFEMEYQITSLDESVHVPAGTFEHCLKVEATGLVQLMADVTQGRYGNAEGTIKTTEWYAPGVGLVKQKREENFDNEMFVDGELTIELLSTTAGS